MKIDVKEDRGEQFESLQQAIEYYTSIPDLNRQERLLVDIYVDYFTEVSRKEKALFSPCTISVFFWYFIKEKIPSIGSMDIKHFCNVRKQFTKRPKKIVTYNGLGEKKLSNQPLVFYKQLKLF